MEALDTFVLSRIQFAANISFHILFPTITIARGWVLLFFRVRFAQTGDEKWMDIYRFWVKVFALSFAMGVVSGITMSFQFGTNWPGFKETVGNIAGPLLASGMTVGFLIAGVSAFRWLLGDQSRDVRTALKVGVSVGALLIPVHIFAGDSHGLNTLEYQPQEIAAMEGNWEAGTHVPLLLFAIPVEAARANRFEIGIPNLASLILTHPVDGDVPGPNEFVAEDGTPLPRPSFRCSGPSAPWWAWVW